MLTRLESRGEEIASSVVERLLTRNLFEFICEKVFPFLVSGHAGEGTLSGVTGLQGERERERERERKRGGEREREVRKGVWIS